MPRAPSRQEPSKGPVLHLALTEEETGSRDLAWGGGAFLRVFPTQAVWIPAQALVASLCAQSGTSSIQSQNGGISASQRVWLGVRKVGEEPNCSIAQPGTRLA